MGPLAMYDNDRTGIDVDVAYARTMNVGDVVVGLWERWEASYAERVDKEGEKSKTIKR